MRESVSFVSLHLPMPPSVNNLTNYGKRKAYPSKAYAGWQKEAGWALVAQKPGAVRGPYHLHLRFCRRETKADLGNLEKAVSDLLQEHGVIENDRLAQSIQLAWVDHAGCLVTVIEAEATTREAA